MALLPAPSHTLCSEDAPPTPAPQVGRYGEDVFDFSAERVTASVSESLQRLQTDYIDIIQCHDIEFGDLDLVSRGRAEGRKGQGARGPGDKTRRTAGDSGWGSEERRRVPTFSPRVLSASSLLRW